MIETSKAQMPSEGERPTRAATILLVDDNEASRYALRRHLNARGFVVAEADDGSSALAAVEAGSPPDLFILDVNLPDMIGFELSRRLRAMPRTARIPILQISATSIDPESQVDGLEAGADAYLVEPVDRSVLVATVRALLRAGAAERAAERRGREWQTTFDAVTTPVCLMEIDGTVMRANTAMAELVGRTPADCIRVPFDTLVDPDGRVPDLHAADAVVQSGTRQIREGSIGGRWQHLVLDPIHDESGGVAAIVATLTDLEDRRRAELATADYVAIQSELYRAAQSARQLLEAVVQQLPVALCVVEAGSGRILVANRRVAETFGDGPAVTGDGAFETWPGRHADGSPYEPGEWPLARTLAAGEVVDAEEIEIDRGDGNARVISVSSGPVRNESGEVVAAVGTWTDVTARKESEALRDTFISILSHELRTPVTTIYAGAIMLSTRRDSIAPAVRAEVLQDVAAESERLQRMIENLLAFARIERGAEPIEPQPVLIQRVLDRVVPDEQRRWPVTTFETSAEPDLPAVSGDQALIELVVRNLLSNAAKYGPVGGRVRVTASVATGASAAADGSAAAGVSAESTEAAAPSCARFVELRVVDQGPGLPAGEEGRIFRVFYRAKQTATKAPGAGIGLFIVRSIVEQMGGETWARDLAGSGAEFGFRLRVFEE